MNNDKTNNAKINIKKIDNYKKYNINGDDKGGSCILPKVEKREDKDIQASPFKRTKTKHFK